MRKLFDVWSKSNLKRRKAVIKSVKLAFRFGVQSFITAIENPSKVRDLRTRLIRQLIHYTRISEVPFESSLGPLKDGLREFLELGVLWEESGSITSCNGLSGCYGKAAAKAADEPDTNSYCPGLSFQAKHPTARPPTNKPTNPQPQPHGANSISWA